MRRKFCRVPVIGVTAGWCALAAGIALAQDTRSQVINVSGRGKVKTAPTSVEIMGTISSDAELAGDALTKFRAVKATVVNAIQKLELANMTVETGSFGVGSATPSDPTSQIMLRQRGGTPDPAKVQVLESVRIRLSKIDKIDRDELTQSIVKIIDTAKESGVAFGPPPGVNRFSINREEYQGFATFMVDDPQALREQAEALAMQDARTKAERLVKLSGGNLGQVVNVALRDQYVPPSLRPGIPEQSTRLDEIEFIATLEVQFRLQ